MTIITPRLYYIAIFRGSKSNFLGGACSHTPLQTWKLYPIISNPESAPEFMTDNNYEIVIIYNLCLNPFCFAQFNIIMKNETRLNMYTCMCLCMI